MDYRSGFKSFKEEEAYVRKNFWSKIKKTASRVPFVIDIVAVYFCAIDKKTPFRVRLTAFSALAYFIVPFDIIPDFLLGGGFTDDAGVLFAAIKTIKPYIREEHKVKAENWLKGNISQEIKYEKIN